MSKEKNGESRKKQAKKKLEMPSIEMLEGELKQTQYKTRYGRVLRSTIFSLLVVAAVAVIIAVLLMPVLQISGNSMEDTLSDGDLVIALNNGKFKTGEVIGFYFNNGILVKRVIATSGDWVDIDIEGTVYVNGVRLDEPYISEKALGECNITLPYQVPDGKCFVMGDHRANSIDSRTTTVGCISGDKIVGKLLLRFWPLRSFGLIR
jgi:signal peptidase I